MKRSQHSIWNRNILAAPQTRAFCWFFFTTRPSSPAIIRWLDKEPGTELKLMQENTIVCICVCTSSEELILRMCLWEIDMIHLSAALQQCLHRWAQGHVWASLLIQFYNFPFLPVLPVLLAAARLKKKTGIVGFLTNNTLGEAARAAPLKKLLQDDIIWQQAPKQGLVLQQLKMAICNAPIFRFRGPVKQFNSKRRNWTLFVFWLLAGCTVPALCS